ncbi:MAG TPA: hypothetical protein VKU60_04995, partial [Chloroflexota bacterium]|nr:hypothetical protein [Chloroflexota bacterium]
GAVTGAHFIQLKGADWWRQLVETQPAITQDRRQQTEWLVRGQYPITIAPDGVSMKEFKNQGLANSVEFLAPDSDMSRWLLQSLSITLVKRAPHPNAAKLFLNWALTHDAQNLLQKIGNVGSRRSDVSAVEGIERPDPKVTYTPSVNKQANEHFETDAENVAKAALK